MLLQTFCLVLSLLALVVSGWTYRTEVDVEETTKTQSTERVTNEQSKMDLLTQILLSQALGVDGDGRDANTGSALLMAFMSTPWNRPLPVHTSKLMISLLLQVTSANEKVRAQMDAILLNDALWQLRKAESALRNLTADDLQSADGDLYYETVSAESLNMDILADSLQKYATDSEDMDVEIVQLHDEL